MDEVLDVASDVNDAVKSFVAVHDDMFARTGLEALFPIDLAENRRRLEKVLGDLNHIQQRAFALEHAQLRHEVHTFMTMMHVYVDRLRTAASQLANLAAQLELKGWGGDDWRVYKAHLSAYDEAVRRYREAGFALNRAWAGIGVGLSVSLPYVQRQEAPTS